MDIAQPPPQVDAADPRPPSAVSSGVGVAGVAGLVIWVLIARHFGAVANTLHLTPFLTWLFDVDVIPERASGELAALSGILLVGIPMVAWSLLVDKVHWRKSTGIDWTLARPVADVLDTSVIKIAGIWATWAIIAVGYSMFRFYWQSTNWNFPFAMQMFQYALLPLVIASVPYIVWLDRYLVEPRDGSWHFGAWIAGRDDWDKDEIFHHLRAWAVKGFFLAFMISIVPGGFQFLVNVDVAKAISQPVSLTQLMITSMFVIDVQLATVGYLL
ncbi:MAG: protein-S-isoprenylcysteine methyltransferase, partial [Casimicrobium sp.]